LESTVANRKISSESTGSEKSTESVADAYEMKQLKYYPDINFPPRLQLLITAHSELGTIVENIFFGNFGQKPIICHKSEH